MRVADGQPQKDGRQNTLRKSDRLLEINGVSVITAVHEEAIALLRTRGDIVTLVVAARNKTRKHRPDPAASLQLAQMLDNTDNQPPSLPGSPGWGGIRPIPVVMPGAPTIQSTSGDLSTVSITKRSDGLGISLAGGEGSDLGGHFIWSITARSAADDAGRLRVGDRVLAIDG
jgi:C-terminal processing protease CtpA/Prc